MEDIYKLGIEKGYSKDEIDLMNKKIIRAWENIKEAILKLSDKLQSPEMKKIIKVLCDKELKKYNYMYSKVKSKRLKKKYKNKIKNRLEELNKM